MPPQWQTLSLREQAEFVDQACQRLGDTEALVEEVVGAGLSREDAMAVIDIIRAAYGRVTLYRMGMRPHQFSGDYDSDPLFREAVLRAEAALPRDTATADRAEPDDRLANPPIQRTEAAEKPSWFRRLFGRGPGR